MYAFIGQVSTNNTLLNSYCCCPPLAYKKNWFSHWIPRSQLSCYPIMWSLSFVWLQKHVIRHTKRAKSSSDTERLLPQVLWKHVACCNQIHNMAVPHIYIPSSQAFSRICVLTCTAVASTQRRIYHRQCIAQSDESACGVSGFSGGSFWVCCSCDSGTNDYLTAYPYDTAYPNKTQFYDSWAQKTGVGQIFIPAVWWFVFTHDCCLSPTYSSCSRCQQLLQQIWVTHSLGSSEGRLHELWGNTRVWAEFRLYVCSAYGNTNQPIMPYETSNAE